MKLYLTNQITGTLNVLLFLYFFLSFNIISFAQNSQEYRGEIIDSDTRKSLPLADILVIGTNISTISNSEGEFLLKVPNEHLDKVVLISYLGYKKQQIPLTEFNNKNKKISLIFASTVLTQVDVNAPKMQRP